MCRFRSRRRWKMRRYRRKKRCQQQRERCATNRRDVARYVSAGSFGEGVASRHRRQDVASNVSTTCWLEPRAKSQEQELFMGLKTHGTMAVDWEKIGRAHV